MQKHPMATKEVAPLRVWLFALVILAILAALGATLFVVLDDPFTFLTDYRGFGTACQAVTAVSCHVSFVCLRRPFNVVHENRLSRMHFVSLVWFAWLAGTVATYWIIPHTWRDIWLIVVSLAFLVVHAPESALLLVIFSLLTFWLGKKGSVAVATGLPWLRV